MTLLKIDLDLKPPREWFKIWIETRKLLLKHLGYTVEDVAAYITVRGIHIYIKIAETIKPETVNMLQFLLGDDHTRVKINQWRIKRGVKNWNKLFHKVIYRKRRETITCWYCGNKIPVI